MISPGRPPIAQSAGPRRVSIITPCHDEIGYAVARRLAGRGDHVVICGQELSLRSIAAGIEREGGSVLIAASAPETKDEPSRVVDRTLARYGRIDTLVNGLHHAHPSSPASADIALGIENIADCIQAVVPHMTAGGGGQIVNMISAAGRYRSAYFREGEGDGSAVVQAGVDGAVFALTRQLGFELAPHKIRVNAVSIGWIRSSRMQSRWDAMSASERGWLLEEISLGRLGEPDEVAAAVEFLASDASSYVTSNAIDVNGGWWMS